MKYQYLSLAALALLGKVSAEQIIRSRLTQSSSNKLAQTKSFQEVSVDDFGFIVLGEQTVVRKESDDIANADKDDDKEVEDEYDGDDDIVDDSGFVHKWVQTSAQISKESDDIANADKDDDKEVEDEFDGDDDIVDDSGFVHKWVQLGSTIQKESDEIANADKDDDKEVEDEYDSDDDIVDDSGFVHKWIQLDSTVDLNIQNNQLLQLKKYSDELANGDSADDRDIHEDEDMNDDVVDVNGQTNAGYGSKVPADYVAQNHIAPGHFITEPRLAQVQNRNFLQLDSDIAVDERESHKMAQGHWWKTIQSMQQRDVELIQLEDRLAKYSDELANGDSADDRDIHEDEDMNDDVVDVNGQTNAGYGSKIPADYVAQNHIAAGHFITEPRLAQMY